MYTTVIMTIFSPLGTRMTGTYLNNELDKNYTTHYPEAKVRNLGRKNNESTLRGETRVTMAFKTFRTTKADPNDTQLRRNITPGCDS